MPRKKSGTFDQNKYVGQYISEHIRYKKINFNIDKPDDKELMDWIDSQHEPISVYLKRLVRQDMEQRKAE